MQSKLGVDGRVVDASATPTPSGRLRSFVVQTTNGPETVPASLVRTALGLRSTWITVGVLRLDKPSTGAVAFGSAARLGGVVRGLGTPRLASSPDGAAWSGAAEVTFDKTGVVTVDVKPTRTTRYRLEAEGGSSPAVLVQVAPRIQLTRPTTLEPTILRGIVRPRLAGVSVTVERRKGSSWVTIGEASVDASGAFVLELDAVVPSGAYRARIAATPGFVAGTSPVLQVTA